MKSDVADKIRYIETNFQVERIRYKNIFLWPYLRTIVFGQYEIKSDNKVVIKQYNKFYSRMFMLFYFSGRFVWSIITTDFFLFLKKNSTCIFTDSEETRLVDGKYISKIENEFINIQKNIVPFYQVKRGTKRAFKHYINRDFTNIIIQLESQFVNIDLNDLIGLDIFYEICQILDVKVNIYKEIKTIVSSYNYYSKLFSKIHPKIIVVNCYYELFKMAMIAAAKSLKIPVIEMQHGIIGQNHIAYNSYKKIDKTPYADFLFSFGNTFKDYVSESIYSPEQIKVVGSYYLDIIRTNFEINKQIFLAKYGKKTKGKIIITVASQWTIDKHLLVFYKEFAEKHEDCFIIFKVRPFEEYHRSYINLLSNLVIETELDTYICMQNSNITSTVNSTCAVETLALGVPALLVNVDNLALSTMKPFFGNRIKSVEYVKDITEMDKAITNLSSLSKEEVINEGNLFFPYGHKQLLQKALKDVEQEFK